jgi:homoserine O-acetyltransferase
MKKPLLIIIILFLAEFAFPQGTQQFGELGNFKLENGSVIENCKIGYRTFGKLNPSGTNAALYPTWFGGTSKDIGTLINPEKLIDSAGLFIIAVDAFGNGVSSSPSNSETQKDEKFPVFSIHDMVKAEYKLLTEIMGIKHLFAAIGGSMGSMQVFDIIAAYPDFVDKAVPYVCSPQNTPYDILHWKIQLDIIENGHKNGMTEKEIMKSSNMFTALLAKTPVQFNEEHSLSDFGKFLNGFDAEPKGIFTSYNFASQIRAILTNDISKYYDNSLKKAAESIKTQMLIIVCKNDHIVSPASSIEFAKAAKSSLLILDSNCGHLSVNCEMGKCRNAIKEFLDK